MIRLCELRSGAAIPAHRHPFEESWYIFSGQGRRSVAGLRYDVAAGDYAQHHTLFVAEIAARAGHGNAASEHYHPFEEIYFFLSGGMRGTLEGDDVQVVAGDLAWLSVDGTHGFVNERDEPARWLEVQSPVPPDSDAFFFSADWRALPHRRRALAAALICLDGSRPGRKKVS